jgi:hypothetical protein
MRRILSKIGVSLLLVGGSFAAAGPAQAEPISGCVGTENLGLQCATVDVTTSEGGYHDCVVVSFILPECVPVDVPVPIPSVTVKCNGEIAPAEFRYICLHGI